MPLSALLSQHLCAGPGSGPASLLLHPVSSCWRFHSFLPGLVDGRPLLPGRIALDLLDYIQDATKQGESCNKVTKGQVPGTTAAAVSMPGSAASSQSELQSRIGGSSWRVC